jgi:hypothetical protein
MISSMQPPNNPGAQYPTWRYHWTKDPLVVHNAGEESALGGGWGDTPGSFAAYRGPRPARTDRQNATQWVDDWPVHGVTPEHRRAIQIELLRADAEFWRSPDTAGAHLATMRQAFDGIAMVLLVAGILSESLLRQQIPQLVWDAAIAAGWWRCASETPQTIFPERLGHYWVWRDERTDWPRLFHDETEVWRVRLSAASARAAGARDLGPRLDAAANAAMISHREQAGRIGIGRSAYFEVKAGRGGKRARRRADQYLRKRKR